MNILSKIVKDKKQEVNSCLKSIKSTELMRNQSDIRIPLDFKSALNQDRLSIISEVKKASPSKGVIREDFNPVQIAKSYKKHGTSCISVLTESKYFLGDTQFLKDIRKSVDVPILRKDFMVDARQMRESYDLGADAILLIVAVLSIAQLKEYREIADSFGLACLVEVHTQKELKIALDLECDLIGINNRNLTTFKTDIHHSIELKKHIPESVTCVSESGINSADDCKLLHENGFHAILVGETLMRQPDPGAYIPTLLDR